MQRRMRRTPSVIETVAGDALLTFCEGTMKAVENCIENEHGDLLAQLSMVTLTSVLHAIFHGKYITNPINMVMLKYSGAGILEHSGPFLIALRVLAQVAGAVGRAKAVPKVECVQDPEKERASKDADVGRALLTVVINLCNSLAMLYITYGPHNKFMSFWVYGLIKKYTLALNDWKKITMNPCEEFASAFVKHDLDAEHVFLHWICPLAGAITAVWIFWFLKIFQGY